MSRYGYVFQPVTQLIRLHDAQSNRAVAGTGVVAIIDTGVGPDHPTLAAALLSPCSQSGTWPGAIGRVSNALPGLVDLIVPISDLKSSSYV
jgi:hypothetical protein